MPEASMALRDWFAGQALTAAISSDPDTTAEALAHMAYTIADAMLAHRSLRDGKETATKAD
jgi:hypothetical protein